MSESTKEFFESAAFGSLGAFSAATAIWAAWAYFTPGDYFANGSSLVLPTLLLVALGAGVVGWRTKGKKQRASIVLMSLVALGYIVLLPDGWWAHGPSRMHSTVKTEPNQSLQPTALLSRG